MDLGELIMNQAKETRFPVAAVRSRYRFVDSASTGKSRNELFEHYMEDADKQDFSAPEENHGASRVSSSLPDTDRPPGADGIVSFGKHKGKSFLTVYNTDADYVRYYASYAGDDFKTFCSAMNAAGKQPGAEAKAALAGSPAGGGGGAAASSSAAVAPGVPNGAGGAASSSAAVVPLAAKKRETLLPADGEEVMSPLDEIMEDLSPLDDDPSPGEDLVTEDASEFQRFPIQTNDMDSMAPQAPGWSKEFPLREEQRRALQWMLNREASDTPFTTLLRQFVPGEALLEMASCSWFLEMETALDFDVRGGILADKVGYGKTSTCLGLIASSLDRESLAQRKLKAKG